MSDDRLKREVIADLGLQDGSAGDFWKVKLIHPVDAIQWVATGKFYSQPIEPVRSWSNFLNGEDDWLAEREAGRFDLSSELVTHAIETGRLRCAYVVPSEHQPAWSQLTLARLEVIPPSEFAGCDVSHSWDDGFSLCVHRDAAEVEFGIWITEFALFWDEVASLRPNRRPEDDEPGNYDPPRSDISRLRTPPVPELSGRRGRPPRQNGAAIAAFLARVVALGLDVAAGEKDDTLGSWLIEEFDRLGETTPHPRNAGKDARGALNVWIIATAQAASA